MIRSLLIVLAVNVRRVNAGKNIASAFRLEFLVVRSAAVLVVQISHRYTLRRVMMSKTQYTFR